MNPAVGLSARISQRIARLNVLRIAQPTRFACLGGRLKGLHPILSDCSSQFLKLQFHKSAR
jgi:hypothetical protein